MKKQMKAKKPSTPRPKLSFTVDRSEFDISSDWVAAVMGPPGAPPQEGPFFAPKDNNATGTQNATAVVSAPVIETAPGVESAAVEDTAPVVKNASPGPMPGMVPVEYDSPVANNATVANNAVRSWKLRPLRRITDGLTPGQYAVYSLMLENAEAGQGSDKIYRGGYADLCRLTGLSKRGVQNVVAELQEKSVIRLHTAPGHHRLQTSIYEVPQPNSVLQGWFANGWRFATGKSKRLTQGATVAI
jgi:hypothetical protein